MSDVLPGPQNHKRKGQVIDSDAISIIPTPSEHTPAGRGSAQLEKRIKAAVAGFADRYGISWNDARILLLDTGVRL